MGREYAVRGQSSEGYRTFPKTASPVATAERRTSPAASTGSAEPAAGLSKPHNVTGAAFTPSLVWYEGASLVDVQGPKTGVYTPPENARCREKIKEWSAASRARLKRLIARLLQKSLANARLITLTYPHDFPEASQFAVYKNHLRVFCQALRRRYPKACGVWKLEFQARGAPHYHLIVLGIEGECLNQVRAWCSQRWYDLAHNGDQHKGKACCQVDPVISKGGVMNYMGKYISKMDQTRPGDFTGRYWGTFGKEILPFGEAKELKLAPEQLTKARRWMRKKIEKDVNQSRWNRFLSKKNHAWQFGNRLFWDHLKSCKQGGAKNMRWTYLDRAHSADYNGEKVWIDSQWCESWNATSLLELLKPPTRWKARCCNRVQVICNASAIVEQVKSYFDPKPTKKRDQDKDAGGLDSFALWSKKAA